MRIVATLSRRVTWMMGAALALSVASPADAQEVAPGGPAPGAEAGVQPDAQRDRQPDSDDTLAPYRDKISAVLAARTGGLTADQAAEKAAARSPEVALRDADVALANARSSRTMAGFLPKLELSASWRRANAANVDFGSGGFLVGALNEGGLTVGNCPDGMAGCIVDAGGAPVASVALGGVQTPPNNYTTQANLSLPLSDYVLSLGLARKAASSDRETALVQREVSVNKADGDARVAYYEWVRTVAQVAVAEQAVAGAQARLEDAKLGLKGGLLAPADVLQIESVLASTKLAVANAKSFRQLARSNLAILMGEPDREFLIGEDVLGAPVSIPGVTPGATPRATEDGSLAELLDRARAERAEIRALAASQRTLELGIDSTSTALYPRVDGIVNFTYANPNPQYFPPAPEWNPSWFVGVTASWALDRYYLTKAQVAELRANVQSVRAQRDMLTRAIELEVTAAWQEWQRARSSLALSQAELSAAEAAYSQRVTLYRGGEATTTGVVDAEIQRYNATMRNIGARIDLHVARAKLIRAAALPNDSSAGSPGATRPPGMAPVPAPGPEGGRAVEPPRENGS